MAEERQSSPPDPQTDGIVRGRDQMPPDARADRSPLPDDPAQAPAARPLPPAEQGAARLSFSAWRLAGALLIAGASDLIGGSLDATFAGVPATIPLDILTALSLWAILGRPVILLVALIAEALPGIGVLPLWTAVVVAIAVTGRIPGRVAR